MKIFEIYGSTGDSIIIIGESLRNLQKYLPAGKVVIITDTNVRRFYSQDFPQCEVIEIGPGEKIKDLDTVKNIYGRLLDLEADRLSFIVGIGGGIVCDIAGFVASTYLRGVRFGFVSSTLLSQVDASIGGKNGVNYRGYKNMVGVFSQPEFVICDMKLLRTLPEREISCGFAEVVKHAVIGNADLFSYLEEHYEEALGLHADVIEKLVYDAIVVKSSIVNRDEKERGERIKLNFGHTFGHAIEKITGIPHGEAVSEGMVIATSLSEKRGHLPVKDTARITALLRKLNLTTRPQVDPETLIDVIKKDKKRRGDNIDFVLLREIGHAFVERISIGELGEMLNIS